MITKGTKTMWIKLFILCVIIFMVLGCVDTNYKKMDFRTYYKEDPEACNEIITLLGQKIRRKQFYDQFIIDPSIFEE